MNKKDNGFKQHPCDLIRVANCTDIECEECPVGTLKEDLSYDEAGKIVNDFNKTKKEKGEKLTTRGNTHCTLVIDTFAYIENEL